MELEAILDILGVDLSTVSQIKEGGLNLYTQFGKRPIAWLRLEDDRFILRFGDAVQPSSVCEEVLTTGVISVRPIRPKLENYNE